MHSGYTKWVSQGLTKVSQLFHTPSWTPKTLDELKSEFCLKDFNFLHLSKAKPHLSIFFLIVLGPDNLVQNLFHFKTVSETTDAPGTTIGNLLHR